MILVGEATQDAREIAFHLADENDPLVGLTGHAWPDIGGGLTDQLWVRLPGDAYAQVAIDQIAEVGYGDYVYRASSLDVATAGDVYLYAAVTGAQPWTGVEPVRYSIAGISVGEAVDARRELPFHLPDAVDPLQPFEGGAHVFAAGEVKIRLPGGAYANADVTRVIAKGHGDYALVLTDLQVAARGKVFLAVIVEGAQPWTAYYDIVPASSADVSAPTVTIVSPTPGAYGGTGFPEDWSIARVTPIVADITDLTPGNRYQCIVARFPGGVERVVYRRGAFRDEFAASSWAEPIADGTRLHILPVFGWPSREAVADITLEFDVVDAAGNLAT